MVDPFTSGCHAHEFQCVNKQCINRDFLCDGDDDCGDGTDELAQTCHENAQSEWGFSYVF